MTDRPAPTPTDPTKGLHPLSQIGRFIVRSGRRIAVTVAGFVVLIAGVVMLITPGPGIVGIIAGLAILATEWAWAEKALDRAKVRAGQAANAATATPFRLGLAIGATLMGIAAAIVYFFFLT
ncbi:MAG TPA: PGPGW domain-containing protein [Actinomycetota bacterium]|nr:PGPGW domain-containing protein [Actinomycetota bacterium]